MVNRNNKKLRFYGEFKVSRKSYILAKYSLVIQLMAIIRDGKTAKILNTENLKLIDVQGRVVGKPDSGNLNMMVFVVTANNYSFIIILYLLKN